MRFPSFFHLAALIASKGSSANQSEAVTRRMDLWPDGVRASAAADNAETASRHLAVAADVIGALALVTGLYCQTDSVGAGPYPE